jgi:hypothetical protein
VHTRAILLEVVAMVAQSLGCVACHVNAWRPCVYRLLLRGIIYAQGVHNTLHPSLFRVARHQLIADSALSPEIACHSMSFSRFAALMVHATSKAASHSLALALKDVHGQGTPTKPQNQGATPHQIRISGQMRVISFVCLRQLTFRAAPPICPDSTPPQRKQKGLTGSVGFRVNNDPCTSCMHLHLSSPERPESPKSQSP